MAITMAPGASSDCTKAYPIASDAPTTSLSHGNTSSVHGESPRPIPEKRYVLVHPRLGTYTQFDTKLRTPTRFTLCTSPRRLASSPALPTLPLSTLEGGLARPYV